LQVGDLVERNWRGYEGYPSCNQDYGLIINIDENARNSAPFMTILHVLVDPGGIILYYERDWKVIE